MVKDSHEKDKVVFAATMASTFEPDSMTNDKIEAATKGHGALVIPVFAAANSIADDIFCPITGPEMSLMGRMTVVDASVGELPLDVVIRKAVQAAMNAGPPLRMLH